MRLLLMAIVIILSSPSVHAASLLLVDAPVEGIACTFRASRQFESRPHVVLKTGKYRYAVEKDVVLVPFGGTTEVKPMKASFFVKEENDGTISLHIDTLISEPGSLRNEIRLDRIKVPHIPGGFFGDLSKAWATKVFEQTNFGQIYCASK